MESGDHISQVELGAELPEINDYDGIAPVYDQVMGEDIAVVLYEKYEPLLEELFSSSGKRCLDMACGTGSFLRKVAKLGGKNGEYYGIDLSGGQLKAAAELAKHDGVTLKLEKSDILDAEFPQDCDLITMNLDAMNHLRHSDDWPVLLKKVFKALKPTGLFLFDINTQERLHHDLMKTEVIVKPNLTYIEVGLKFEKLGEFVLQQQFMQIFHKEKGVIKEYLARIQQIAPSQEKLKEMLAEAGFAPIKEVHFTEEDRRRHIFLKHRFFIRAGHEKG